MKICRTSLVKKVMFRSPVRPAKFWIPRLESGIIVTRNSKMQTPMIRFPVVSEFDINIPIRLCIVSLYLYAEVGLAAGAAEELSLGTFVMGLSGSVEGLAGRVDLPSGTAEEALSFGGAEGLRFGVADLLFFVPSSDSRAAFLSLASLAVILS